MRKIGIISDTHNYLPSEIYFIFNDVDLIIHAGDIGNIRVYEDLCAIAEVIAVHGNADGYPLRSMFPKQKIITEEGFRLHISHYEQVDHNEFDIVVCGHTHHTQNEYTGNCLVLNPGTCNRSRSRQNGKASVITLEIEKNKKPLVNIHFLND